MEGTETSQIDLRQSAPYAKYITQIGWRVETVGNINIFIKPLGLFGAIAKIQRVPLPIPWTKIQPILKKYQVWMTKLEPLNSSPVPKRFRQDLLPLLATKTQRIDLVKPFRFKKDTRYSLRKVKGQKSKIKIDEFDNFYDLWKKANRIKKLWTPSKIHFDVLVNAFSKNCFCITVNDLAGALVLVHDKVAYYYYAASLPEAKRKSLPYLVVYKCLQEAKKRRCKIWDWEGIYDSRWSNKGWRGFTHFKKSFGGYDVLFPGSFTRWF